ncbi:hypothetical protein FB45DRAFT_873810 [Roridomyces roridus]|uniref:Uncharacterized protein n=1 Tax=Roridomyces roridus TaxID=1738132 RepID=A0AAD7BAF9_9AGAR|nr:hypothetical protein FB45DRAFT_873810 [Roridomyces roridus]
MDEVVQTNSSPPSSSPPLGHSTSTSQAPTSSLQASYNDLESRSQAVRQDVVAKSQDNTQTGAIYLRHYKAYIDWFTKSEARRVEDDVSYTPIPPLPITVAKVTLFLDYEMTRPKSTSTCGHQHAKQVVSALEHHRFNNQHLYANNPSAQVNLRTDGRIKTLESAFQESEPERIQKSHAVKASGTRAGL